VAGPETEASRGFFAAQRDDRLVSLAALGLQDKTDALAACEAVCVPSLEESLGGVYLEAWTQAKPVIACPIPAVMQVVEDGCDGFLSPQEPEPLARALLACLNGEGQRLGEAGRRKVAQRYSWERAAAQVETLYRQLVVGVSGTPER
jgi:glycosyltransferase involved in cell wall biosynthesis